MKLSTSHLQRFFRDGRYLTLVPVAAATLLSVVAASSSIYLFMAAGRAQLPTPLAGSIFSPAPLAAIIAPHVEGPPPAAANTPAQAVVTLADSEAVASVPAAPASARIAVPPAPQNSTPVTAGAPQTKGGGQGSGGSGGAVVFNGGGADDQGDDGNSRSSKQDHAYGNGKKENNGRPAGQGRGYEDGGKNRKEQSPDCRKKDDK